MSDQINAKYINSLSPLMTARKKVGRPKKETSTMIDVLNGLSDVVIAYRAFDKTFNTKITLDLPKEAYNRFNKEFKKTLGDKYSITEFTYGGIKFSINKLKTMS